MKVMMLLISLLLAGMNLQSEPLQPQGVERTKELARAVELGAQVLKLYNEGRYKEALPLAQQVIEIRQRLLPPNDPLLGAALSNLGFLLVAAKKDGEAEKAFKGALSVYESHPEKNLAIASVLQALAYIRVRKHDYESGESLLLRFVQIQEKELGPTNAKTVEAMKDYACLRFVSANKGIPRHREPDALERRATCWLVGFESDCSKEDVTSGDVMNGKAIRLVQPSYPVGVRQKRLTGRIFVAVLIDERGNVINARAMCGGYPELNAAGVEAARLSKFSPTRVNDKAIQVTGWIVYNFLAQ